MCSEANRVMNLFSNTGGAEPALLFSQKAMEFWADKLSSGVMRDFWVGAAKSRIERNEYGLPIPNRYRATKLFKRNTVRRRTQTRLIDSSEWPDTKYLLANCQATLTKRMQIKASGKSPTS